MRLSYILVVAASILSAHHEIVAAAGNDVALTAVMSFGFLYLADADQSISHQSRFLRGDKITEDENEERVISEAQKLVNQLFLKTKSFSALQDIHHTDTMLDDLLVAADAKMTEVFKRAANTGMLPDDLAKILQGYEKLDDKFRALAVDQYTDYLVAIGKIPKSQ
ncbi:hypothetical protein F444_13313 [Phytophthora nicotianae P1976]|uniref:RxLR effector protein n=1 Tax=Phytophthora nicotianae P1976 TaxID=1317066 RepID=A0A080ZU71_PHYNI|nr:hypothetical protein F444_13313 [Phytophthora nicotianae P1976]